MNSWWINNPSLSRNEINTTFKCDLATCDFFGLGDVLCSDDDCNFISEPLAKKNGVPYWIKRFLILKNKLLLFEKFSGNGFFYFSVNIFYNHTTFLICHSKYFVLNSHITYIFVVCLLCNRRFYRTKFSIYLFRLFFFELMVHSSS